MPTNADMAAVLEEKVTDENLGNDRKEFLGSNNCKDRLQNFRRENTGCE